MTVYTVVAHECLHGSVKREYFSTRYTAMFQAERLFNRGEYLWVDVILKDRAGRVRHVHHIERAPTDAERIAICARYAT